MGSACSQGLVVKGAGTISYQTPAESLRPFFRRKFITYFRYVLQLNWTQGRDTERRVWAEHKSHFEAAAHAKQDAVHLKQNLSCLMHFSFLLKEFPVGPRCVKGTVWTLHWRSHKIGTCPCVFSQFRTFLSAFSHRGQLKKWTPAFFGQRVSLAQESLLLLTVWCFAHKFLLRRTWVLRKSKRENRSRCPTEAREVLMALNSVSHCRYVLYPFLLGQVTIAKSKKEKLKTYLVGEVGAKSFLFGREW